MKTISPICLAILLASFVEITSISAAAKLSIEFDGKIIDCTPLLQNLKEEKVQVNERMKTARCIRAGKKARTGNDGFTFTVARNPEPNTDGKACDNKIGRPASYWGKQADELITTVENQDRSIHREFNWLLVRATILPRFARTSKAFRNLYVKNQTQKGKINIPITQV